MKITVLVDNYITPGRHFYGEPGLSYFIEYNGINILFDTGFSDLYLKNAKILNVDLSKTNYLILSHSHHDHTLGLKFFPYSSKKIALISHLYVLQPRYFGEKIWDPPITKKQAEQKYNYIQTKAPYFIYPNIAFLGEIKRQFDFEKNTSMGETVINGKKQPDFVTDDTALAIKTQKGIIVITGCSHSGICNIIAQAKKVFKVKNIYSVIGGFHLYNANNKKMIKTADYLKKNIKGIAYPCHCTGFKAKCAIAKKIKIEEVFIGKIILL